MLESRGGPQGVLPLLLQVRVLVLVHIVYCMRVSAVQMSRAERSACVAGRVQGADECGSGKVCHAAG